MNVRLALRDQIRELRALKTWRETLPRICFAVSAPVTRADTTPKALYTIPAGSEAHLMVIHGETGSNASTGAVLDVGRPGAPAAFVNGHSVLGAAGVGQKLPAARKLGVTTPDDVSVTGRYTETGTPSTDGGPWIVTLFYSKAGN
jgi:hypothetical protein